MTQHTCAAKLLHIHGKVVRKKEISHRAAIGRAVRFSAAFAAASLWLGVGAEGCPLLSSDAAIAICSSRSSDALGGCGKVPLVADTAFVGCWAENGGGAVGLAKWLVGLAVLGNGWSWWPSWSIIFLI